jgi:hypothetical protein
MGREQEASQLCDLRCEKTGHGREGGGSRGDRKTTPTFKEVHTTIQSLNPLYFNDLNIAGSIYRRLVICFKAVLAIMQGFYSFPIVWVGLRALVIPLSV